MEKEENRFQKIREWALEEALNFWCYGESDVMICPSQKEVIETALLFEDYVLNGDKGGKVGALLKPEE